MKHIIIPANLQVYHLEAALFELNGSIDWKWKKNYPEVQVGDFVYIYSGVPVQGLCYKTVVVDANCSDVYDDRKFYSNPKDYEDLLSSRFIRLKVVSYAKNSRVTLKELISAGCLKTAPQNGILIRDEAWIGFIESFFDNGNPFDLSVEANASMLSTVFYRYGLNPRDIKIVRHSYNNQKCRHCYESGFLDAYQAIQSKPVFNYCSYIAAFMGEEKGTTAVFVGLYEVKGSFTRNLTERMPDNYPFPEEYKADKYWFDLRKTSVMSDLIGKLRIDWGSASSTRSWCQEASKDKQVIEASFGGDNLYPEIIDDSVCIEGAVQKVSVNRYERSQEARVKCIAFHGCRCKVCDLDFEKMYGELGKNFIHVHHIVPLSEISKEYEVDPVKDLIPVCPNCHAMLHRSKKDALDWKELRTIVQNKRGKG